ncbi:MAG: IPT/TIG domain-containing protein, partial [Gammaproteobacteria bacterium]
MRTFTQKPKDSKQSVFTNSSMCNQEISRNNPEVRSILHLQRTIGNQTVQRMLQSEAGLAGNASTGFKPSKLKVGSPVQRACAECEDEMQRKIADKNEAIPIEKRGNLAQKLQQDKESVARIRRWSVGPAPAPAGWAVVTDPAQLRRLNQAESIVRSVLPSRRCQTYFSSRCGAPNALRDAFDNSNVYVRPLDDNVFGARTGGNIAFNLRAFRIGRFMMASTLLHEMFHTCDPTPRATQNLRELNSENAVETCRLHTPWIDEVSPRRAAAGTRVTIRGWGFGPVRSAVDEVRIGGVPAPIVSWSFMTDASSRVEIVVEVPAGAAAGGITVINNRVA